MMRTGHMSVSGLSITFALLLALWEVYFFGFAGEHLLGPLDGTIGLFTPERLGFNMAWLTWAYLSFQLISIPFALPTARTRFIGVLDGMASLVPLAVVLVVVFGKSNLLRTLHEVPEGVEQLGAERAVDHPVVARQRHRHPGDEAEAVRGLDRPALAGADRQDRGLRRIDDRRELADAVHAEVGDCARAALIVARLEL